MSRRYTAEQLYAAMLDLVGDGNLGDRVYGALITSYTLKATAEDCPDPDDRHKWDQLQVRMTGGATEAIDRKAAYRTSVDSIGGSELKTVAQEFLDLFSSAAEELGADNEERRGSRQKKRS